MTTKPTTEAVEALAEIISGPDEDGVIDETWSSEVINKLRQNGFTITRAEPAMSEEESLNDNKFISELGDFMHGKGWAFADIQLKALELAKKYRGQS